MNILKKSYINTPIGTMIVVADDNALYLLEFVESKRLEQKIALVRKTTGVDIIEGCTAPITSIESE